MPRPNPDISISAANAGAEPDSPSNSDPTPNDRVAPPAFASSTPPTRDEIDAALVARLIGEQFPKWAGLPVRPVASAGWDNKTFHLGDAMSVRLPSGAAYAAQVAKEHRWLPALAPRLPLPIPVPLAMGRPASASDAGVVGLARPRAMHVEAHPG